MINADKFASGLPFVYFGVVGVAIMLFVATNKITTKELKKFENVDASVTVAASCIPRPACLDAKPYACEIPEPENGWCPQPSPTDNDVVCTQDMVMCADGSYAPRDPQNGCKALCPTSLPDPKCISRPSWCDKRGAKCDIYGINWCTRPKTATPSMSLKPSVSKKPIRTLVPFTPVPRQCPQPYLYNNVMCPDGSNVKIDPNSCRVVCPVLSE